MRLGIFGGSFDPVHYGHLLAAETCREQCQLDQVWFVPAAIPPHKQDESLSTSKQRVEMLKLAIAGHEQFWVSTVEIERGGISYTADTLASLQEQNPEAALFFLMGADSLRDLPSWREPQRICELAIPLVVRRSGAPQPNFDLLKPLVGPTRLDQIRQSQTETPVIQLSSTDLRQRARGGRSIRYRTPRAVERYVQEHRLYQGES